MELIRRSSYFAACLSLVAACGSSDPGDPDDGTLDPGDAPLACTVPEGFPAPIGPNDVQEIEYEGPSFWSYRSEYATTNTIDEFSLVNTALQDDGWRVFQAAKADYPVDGWEWLSLIAVRGNEVMYAGALGETPFAPDYSGDLELVYGEWPNPIGDSLLPALHLPADAELHQVLWTPSVHELNLTFATGTDYRSYQQEVEAIIEADGLDLILTYDQETGLTYFSSDMKVSLGITPLTEGRLMVSVGDRSCIGQTPGGDGV